MDTGTGFEVRAGKRAVMRTNAGEPLTLQSRPLADAVASEWQAAEARAKPGDLPLARLALGAADVAGHRREVEDATVAYAETDLVCYRAGAAEADLAGRQERAWGPLLEWAADRFGARLEATRGIVPHPQAGEALEALARAVAAYADAELAALRAAAATCGSLVIALALLEGEIAPDAAWQAAHLDERAQAERWGVDAEAKAAMAARRGDLEAVAEFVRLWRQE